MDGPDESIYQVDGLFTSEEYEDEETNYDEDFDITAEEPLTFDFMKSGMWKSGRDGREGILIINHKSRDEGEGA